MGLAEGLKLAELFDLDLRSWSSDDEDRLQAALLEVFGDPMFDSFESFRTLAP